MNRQPQILSLTIAVVSLLDATVLTTTASAQRQEFTHSPTRLIAQTAPAKIERTWQAEGNKLQVKFYQENNILKGKIVALPPGAETKDVKNPDPKLRSRNLVGSVMFTGFTYDPTKKIWSGGTVYIPDMGRTMKPKLALKGDRVEMQISMGLMSRTVTMTPID
jgi:uncharacterized protein (DUF2147 family)